jgi:hypothetical protein
MNKLKQFKNKLRSMYAAGRSGQPMPVNADRSIGEVALQTTVVVGVMCGTFFVAGSAGRILEPFLMSKKDREVHNLQRDIKIEELRINLESYRKNPEE